MGSDLSGRLGSCWVLCGGLALASCLGKTGQNKIKDLVVLDKDRILLRNCCHEQNRLDLGH